MDFPLKTFAFVIIVLFLAGEITFENLAIILITGYLMAVQLGIYSGAPVYT